MNIRCPHCQTVFRVNPERIPPGGVRAKCARCGDTFTVTPPPAAAATAESQTAAPRGVAATTPAPASSSQSAAAGSASPATAAGPVTANAPPAGATQATQAAAAPAAPFVPPPSPPTPAAPAQTSGTPMFGARDPRARAERLARALVSDIVAYHPERRDRSLESGTLRTEFREEIMKSWEEYVAQVGLETAKSTPYFRDALNTILARGQKLF